MNVNKASNHMNMMMVAYLIFDNPKKLLLSDCAILTVQEGSTF